MHERHREQITKQKKNWTWKNITTNNDNTNSNFWGRNMEQIDRNRKKLNKWSTN